MESWLTPTVLGPAGGLALIIFFPYIQMARGKLRPESAFQEVVQEKEYWRESSNQKDETIKGLTVQNGELLEALRPWANLIKRAEELAE